MNKIAIFEYYKIKGVRELTHKVKQNDTNSIKLMASFFVKKIKSSSKVIHLIPIPNSGGNAEYTLQLVNEIKAQSQAAFEVLDILESEPRMSLYEAKKNNLKINFKFSLKNKNIKIPDNSLLIDNVIGTGITMMKARNAIGKDIPLLAFAIDSASVKYKKELTKSIKNIKKKGLSL